MSLRFVRELTAPEQAVLNETYKTGPAVDLGRRCHAVLLSADGWSVPQVAQLLRVDQATVHRWLDRFTTEGVAGLTTQWSNGRPPAWDEAYEWLLVETVRHDPRWYGLAQSLWTCALLAGHLAEQTAIHLSSERVRVLLHQHGIHLKQPTPVVHSRDPRYDPKRAKVEAIRATDEPTVVVLDLDQAELALNPTRTRVWAPIGVPWEVETPGNNQKQAMFGAVNSRSGQTYFQLREHKRSADFQQFVDSQILPAHPYTDLFFLIVDGAAIYKSKSTRAWLKERPQVVLVPLPSYAPNLNLQEQIWRWLRAEVTHNHYFGSLAAAVAAAKQFFAKVAALPATVLSYIGRTSGPLERALAQIT
ncbi:MAG: IS630 family transposase [Chloroflexi bacterium]|nr:IS630 family transposase [Chloroflexota bacterium]